jgi:hypothetical protein
MTRYAHGTSEAEIKKADAAFYGNKKLKITPTPAPKNSDKKKMTEQQNMEEKKAIAHQMAAQAAKKSAMDKKKVNTPASRPVLAQPASKPAPFKPDYTDPVRPRSPMDVQPKTGVLPSKPANAPMEQVEIDKANKMAATPQTYMPQANAMPNAQMAAMQKMPQPGAVPPANARPMAPPPVGGAPAMKRGGAVRNKPAAKFSSGGSTSKASSRGDGIAQRGKTKGRYI